MFAYSVLTHEQIVDLVWSSQIQPLLLKRYPGLTEVQTERLMPAPKAAPFIQDLATIHLAAGNSAISCITSVAGISSKRCCWEAGMQMSTLSLLVQCRSMLQILLVTRRSSGVAIKYPKVEYLMRLMPAGFLYDYERLGGELVSLKFRLKPQLQPADL